MKAFLVARREYIENVRKKSFVVGTLLGPVFLILIYAIPIAAVFFSPDEQTSIAVLDRTGEVGAEFAAALDDTLKDGRPRYDVVAVVVSGDFDRRKATLTESIKNDALDVLIEVPADVFEAGRVSYIAKDVFNESVTDAMRDRINPLIIRHRLEATGLDYGTVAKMTARVRLDEMKLTKSGVMEEKQLYGQFAVVFVFVMILYVSLLSWGMSVQRSVIEEKSSRVIEVMLSSVDPIDLFAGKIVGVGAVGLTQVVVWSVLALAATAVPTFIAAAQFMNVVSISVLDLVYFAAFFVLGFLFYSALFMVIGAACNTEQEAQQLQSVTIIPLIIPLMMLMFILQNANTTLAVVLSMIPFFTPMLMLARVVLVDVPAWQVVLSFAILIVSIYGAIYFSARVFRVGILMYGKRPSLREIFRWFRYA